MLRQNLLTKTSSTTSKAEYLQLREIRSKSFGCEKELYLRKSPKVKPAQKRLAKDPKPVNSNLKKTL